MPTCAGTEARRPFRPDRQQPFAAVFGDVIGVQVAMTRRPAPCRDAAGALATNAAESVTESRDVAAPGAQRVPRRRRPLRRRRRRIAARAARPRDRAGARREAGAAPGIGWCCCATASTPARRPRSNVVQARGRCGGVRRTNRGDVARRAPAPALQELDRSSSFKRSCRPPRPCQRRRQSWRCCRTVAPFDGEEALRIVGSRSAADRPAFDQFDTTPLASACR
jgi:hypothetical protein